MIGWLRLLLLLLLCRGRDWLLWGFPLLWDPAGGGGGGRVINYGAAVGVDERLACQIEFRRDTLIIHHHTKGNASW